jgi:hypothetical protein
MGNQIFRLPSLGDRQRADHINRVDTVVDDTIEAPCAAPIDCGNGYLRHNRSFGAPFE